MALNLISEKMRASEWLGSSIGLKVSWAWGYWGFKGSSTWVWGAVQDLALSEV